MVLSFFLLVVLALVAAATLWTFITAHLNPPTSGPIIILLQPTRERMDRGVEYETYSVQPHPGHEVVEGMLGSYYDVDFKSASSRQSLFFAPKEYQRSEFDADFKASVGAFRRDVLDRISRGHVKYKIFIQGSADVRGNDAPLLGHLVEGEGKDIVYLPAVPGNINRFYATPAIEHIPKNYANLHLPDLRAAFLQDELRAYDLPATILQGSVTKLPGDIYRNATMLLYVRWPAGLAESRRGRFDAPPNSQ